MMKNVIERPRPQGHLPIDDGFSFPSGHAVSVTLVCLALVLIFIPMLKKSWVKISTYTIVLLFWFSVLFSRIYFSAHHLTDVLSGVVLGIFWICIAMAIYGMVSGWLKAAIFKKSKI
jgi:phosphatidylglycerophosphatase B